jgi:hypothetical protein
MALASAAVVVAADDDNDNKEPHPDDPGEWVFLGLFVFIVLNFIGIRILTHYTDLCGARPRAPRETTTTPRNVSLSPPRAVLYWAAG